MAILEKINNEKLDKYIEDGLIVKNKHPEYDLWILNYSPKTQFSQYWDDYTSACRGLVIDVEGNIVARPFKKFKNYQEHDPNEIDLTKDHEIFEKMDGSLIILFYYDYAKKWIVASRGSFISDQSIMAKKILVDKNILDNNREVLKTPCTYLFELLHPENRIVVYYGDMEDLVLLGVIDTKTGNEMLYNDMILWYSNPFTIIKKHNIKLDKFEDLNHEDFENREGFVIKFADNFRVKFKFAEYVRLHSIVTNLSNITVWEYLRDGQDFEDILYKVPDEFYNWVIKVKAEFEVEFCERERSALSDFNRIHHINGKTDRKEFAAQATKTENTSILFKLFDKRPYRDIIWRMIKPEHSKPFF